MRVQVFFFFFEVLSIALLVSTSSISISILFPLISSLTIHKNTTISGGHSVRAGVTVALIPPFLGKEQNICPRTKDE